MQTVQQELQALVNQAVGAVLPGVDLAGVSVGALRVVPCANAQFGDYQFNGALPLAKLVKTNPRTLAGQIVERIEMGEIGATPEIAGPGFINFRLAASYVESKVAAAAADSRLGVPTAAVSETIVVDFSAPNVAKPMHVGHIRSTIIGDALARLLAFAGHHVVRDNHIGDWGTAFGKIIVGWKSELDAAALEADPIGEMERLYRTVNARSEKDAFLADEARLQIARLQAGDAENLAIWQRIRELSQREFDSIYERLGVNFDVTLGESFYNDRLGGLVEDLVGRGLAQQSQGAIVVAFAEPKHLVDQPMLIQKSDGAANYATTDLATLAYRVERWNPDEILYVVDARQSLHFQQLFETARLWGFTEVKLRHISFGSVLGEDNTPIKTRSGGTIKLRDLLDEAESRALDVVRAKNPDLPDEQQRDVARVVGIGAVKYADLAQNRTSDYLFSWDKMLAMQGNTAPYLQYAYVRIRSIFRRAQEHGGSADGGSVVLQAPEELELGKFLLRLGGAIESSLSDYRPNALTDYLFELAQKFTAFYDACPVLKSEEPLRSSRLTLCRFTADTLKCGLGLLGIETIEQM